MEGQGSTGILDGDEDGRFVGGYRASIASDLDPTPTWPRRGDVGLYEYDCTTLENCPGAVDWVEHYFGPGYDFEYEFWGWVYETDGHGTWVNASSGSFGDIG